MLSSLLSEYCPLVITTDKKEDVQLFNKPTSKHRLLIATLKCLDHEIEPGLDLGFNIRFDDVDGKFPRHVFLTLGMDVSKLNTAFTKESKSKTTIQFIYDKENEKEVVHLGRKNRHCSRFFEE